jgi:hypothetical protein
MLFAILLPRLLVIPVGGLGRPPIAIAAVFGLPLPANILAALNEIFLLELLLIPLILF